MIWRIKQISEAVIRDPHNSSYHTKAELNTSTNTGVLFFIADTPQKVDVTHLFRNILND